MRLMRDYGLATTDVALAASMQGTCDAARTLGHPVVLKTATTGVLHKVDEGGVVLAIRDDAELPAAYREVSGRLGPQVVVQPQVNGSVELALGVVRDPLLGPMVLLAVGGTFVELIDERCVALPPLTIALAEAMVNRLPVVAKMLTGVRGQPPADRSAVVHALVGIGQLAVAVDVLVIERGQLVG